MRIVITPESPSSQAPAGPDPADRLRPDDRAGAFGTRHGAPRPVELGLADPAWTRLAVAGVVPVLLAMTAVLPVWARLAIVVILVPLAAQGWPALVRSEHDPLATGVITLTGVAAALTVALRDDFGSAGVVMALSVLAAFVSQMLRRDGRDGLVEDLSSTVAGNLVVVPCALALFVGAVLTTLRVRAPVLELLTVVVPALVAGAAGGSLAAVGFFGPAHVGIRAALQSAAACLVVGFVAGILMATANRVLWTHRWVPGGRAAVASAIVPVLAVGGPVYAIARLLGGFIAG